MNKGFSGKAKILIKDQLLAEGEGFEPPVGCPTTVFKTVALDRSAIPPEPVIFDQATKFYHIYLL